MSVAFNDQRRRWIKHSAAGLVLAGGIAAPALIFPAVSAEQSKSADKDDKPVTPPEDLMREHGVLDRVLLIYEAAMQRFAAKEQFDPAVLTDAAGVVRDFIENYHEKSEETAVFPRFLKAGKMVDLVKTLTAQHEAGRRVTATILKLAPHAKSDGDERHRLAGSMQAFIRMYRPHAAREDTDLFPKLRDLVASNEYDAMAEDFEEKEHQLFGEDGFEKMADRVAQLERKIGIHDLNRFTPA